MGLLDNVLGQVLGGGKQQQLITEMATGLLNQGEGSLNQLKEKFQQHGLGDVFASWVKTGENLPISSEQLQKVLGTDLTKMAQNMGVEASHVADMAKDLLPKLIDQATPNGVLPTAEQASNLVQGALKKLFSS